MYLNEFRNHIKDAVNRIGGPTKAAHAIGVSNTTVHEWINRRRVPCVVKATLMAKLSGKDVRQLRSV